MFEAIIENLKIIVVLDVLCSLFRSFEARSGCGDAFRYKKSNTRIRKELKNFTKFQRVFWIYDKKLTFVPNYLKMFYALRVFEPVYSAIVVLLYFLSNSYRISKLVLLLILFRLIFITIPHYIYFFYCNIVYRDPKNPKGWGFKGS